MKSRSQSLALAAALSLAVLAAPLLAKSEIKGAAILDHPCGKVAVEHMGLVHDGKMDEAVKLGTPEMQKQWAAIPAGDRAMMVKMMQGMSQSKSEFSEDIKQHGVLVVDGADATLTVQVQQHDANGSSTSTMTQNYKLDGSTCRISH